MSAPDLWFEDGRSKFVGNLTVTTTGDNDRTNPDLAFYPKWASLTLGGGAGSNSDGDIKLQDRDDENRIHLTGGKGGDFGSTRVQVDGRNATAMVGGNGQNGAVELEDEHGNTAGVVKATPEGLELTDGQGNTGLRIEPGGDVKVRNGGVDPL